MGNKNDLPRPVTLHPIGVIHSPHRRAEETPVQPVYAHGICGWIEVFPEYEEGLRDLEGFSHIHLLYELHQSTSSPLIVKPFLDTRTRGIFATRAPWRPNPIGLSLVRLTKREANVLRIEDVDILDGTPLLDIKPYVARFDQRAEARCGWFDAIDEHTAQVRGLRGFKSAPTGHDDPGPAGRTEPS